MFSAYSLSARPANMSSQVASNEPRRIAVVDAPTFSARLSTLTTTLRDETNQQVTLFLSNETSAALSLSADTWQMLRQSLHPVEGQIEIATIPGQNLVSFRYDRLSNEGEWYPTRLMLHGTMREIS